MSAAEAYFGNLRIPQELTILRGQHPTEAPAVAYDSFLPVALQFSFPPPLNRI